MKGLSVTLETIKTLRRKHGRTLFDRSLSDNSFLSVSSGKGKAEINKGGLIKFWSFCTARGTISKMKRQPTEWEEIFASIYTKSSYNSIWKEQTASLQNGQKIWIKFSKEDKQMANRHMKRCSTSLIIREMRIKTTMRYHLTPVSERPSSKNLQTINAGEGVRKENPPTLLLRL